MRILTRISLLASCVALLPACAGDTPAGGADARPASDGSPPLPDGASPAGDAAAPVNPLDGIGSAELVANVGGFLEGPTWRSSEGVLLFTDIPGDRIMQLNGDGSLEVFRSPSANANGLISDQNGLLIAAEHGSRRVSRTLADGTIASVAERFEGMLLNSPNDVEVRSDGVIYFTDPPYGLPNQGDGRELDFNGIFRVATDGTVTAEWRGALSTRPNGVVLSLDESTLYVADTTDEVVRTFSVGH